MNPTQSTGLLVFGIAAAACLAAARRRRSPWLGLAAIHAVFTLDVGFGGRHRLHDLADRLLQTQGVYGDRQALQLAALAVGAVVLAVALVAIVGPSPRGRTAPERLALTATTLTATVFGVEIVSLHATDAWLYAPLDRWLAIAAIWSALAAIVAGCALRTMVAAPVPRPSRR